jgi:hypothetical protein
LAKGNLRQAESGSQPLDDDPVEFVKAVRNRGGASSASCAVSVVNRGKAVAVYPSVEVDATMREWRGVEVVFGRSVASGKVKSVKLTKADGGLKIRRYDQQHVKVCVSAPAGTVAKSSNGTGKQSCDGTVVDDGNSVLIALPATITFEPAA